MHHSLGDFIDRAVAAGSYDQTDVFRDGSAREGDGIASAGSRQQRSFVALFGENLSSAFQPARASTPQLPGSGIIDDDAPIILCDELLSCLVRGF